MKLRLIAVTAVAAALLAGCTGTATQPTGSADSAPSTAQGTHDTVEAFLARNGLEGLGATEIIDKLEATNDDRQQGPMGSVRATELVLSDDQSEVSLPMPADQFYLSVAPYFTQTHDCFNHNLASCQGELANEVFKVTIIDEAGTTLVDDEYTSHDNGFIGFWLPADISGTLTIEQDDKQTTIPISTGANDPTCLTTTQLS